MNLENRHLDQSETLITPLKRFNSRMQNMSTSNSVLISANHSMAKSVRKMATVETQRSDRKHSKNENNKTTRHMKTDISQSKTQRHPSLLSKLNLIVTQQSSILKESSIIKKQDLKSARFSLSFIKGQFLKNNKSFSLDKQLLYREVELAAEKFYKNWEDNKLKDCIETIMKFLHFTIDYNLIKEFSLTLYYLAQFYFLFSHYEEAIYYYNQSRICSLMTVKYDILILSLIGLSRSCSKICMHERGIIFLKKALEYSWLCNNKDIELRIYDQIGMKYYRMGQIEMAQFFHKRYERAGFQSEISAVKTSVKYKLKQRQRTLQKNKQKQITSLFLIRLNLPIKTLEDLPYSNDKYDSVRQKYLRSTQTKFEGIQSSDKQIKKILKEKDFQEEIPYIFIQENQKYQILLDQKKHAFDKEDLEFNHILAKYQNKHKPKIVQSKDIKDSLLYKMDLEKQIQNRLNKKPIDKEWYQKILDRTVQNRKFKIDAFQHQILIRGFHKDNINLHHVRELYNSYFVDILFL